jgi:hypothetical protein
MSADALSTLTDHARFRRQRRELLMVSPRLTGLDWVERVDGDAGHLHLRLHFVPSTDPAKPAIPPGIKPGNIRVTADFGAGVAATSVQYPPDRGTTLAVDVRVAVAEFGTDTEFALLEIHDCDAIDPLFARATFSLARQELAAIDPVRPARRIEGPSSRGIDYLAKDFNSFSRLMLDHMAAVAPDWQERHPADIGVVVVEVLAYAADYLSYFQDAVATEAYLTTARLRKSVRRHARMLDYRTYENCASRIWLQITVAGDGKLPPGFRAFCTHGPYPSIGGAALGATEQSVFEPIENVELLEKHNSLPFYNWGVADFRIRAGATSATLDGHFPDLKKGHVLVFGPRLGSVTMPSSGAHPPPGHPIRLVRPSRLTSDPLNNRMITEIAWADGDALPFDLNFTEGVSYRDGHDGFVAFGNIVAADAGVTIGMQDKDGSVADDLLFHDVVCSVPYDRQREQSAQDFMLFDRADALPAIHLATTSDGPGAGEVWNQRPDLLDSDRYARDFVAETDDNGVTTLRFGNGVHGGKPRPGTRFRAKYRTASGNDEVGAYSVRNWEPKAGKGDLILTVTNPVPARGGCSPQPIREIRRDAPEKFRKLLHCAIEQDFVVALKDDARVRAAVTQARWIGSRHSIGVYVQRTGGFETDAAFLEELEAKLDARRILGTDVTLHPPNYVPLWISLTITVQPSYASNAVRREVAHAAEELYFPGRLSFGESVYLSPLVARAIEVAGVGDVKVDAFHCFGRQPRGEIEAGRIEMGPTEIARIDNRANAASRGRLIVNVAAAAPAGRP